MNESIAFTGHRPDKLDNDYEMTSRLVYNINIALLDTIHKEKPREIVCGMAIGVDMLVAKLAICMEYPLIACIPYKGQDQKWNPRDKAIYSLMLQKAKEIILCDLNNIIVTYEQFLKHDTTMAWNYKYLKRNEYMVNRCDKLVGVSDNGPSGTERCIKYAEHKGKPVIRIDINKYRS